MPCHDAHGENNSQYRWAKQLQTFSSNESESNKYSYSDCSGGHKQKTVMTS